jgi:3-hydroxy-3-methylglutaryl CoA synthase
MAVIDKQSKAQVNDIIELKMHDKPRIGIDSIVVSAPQTNFSSEELGKAIGVDPKRISDRLGIEKTRLPIFSQSNVTMVADSIYLFIKNMEKTARLKIY